jgi:hypothetical protein
VSALSGAVPELAVPGYALILEVERAGLQARVTSVVRSHAKQAKLYRDFLAGISALPAAPPGQSAHEYGLAFDMLVSPYEYQADVGALWEAWGGAWGGVADPVHFELPGASAWARQQPVIDSNAVPSVPWWEKVASWISG